VIIAAVLAATLLVVGWLALSGAVPLSAAGTAVAGVAIVGARLSLAGYSAGTLTESARYVDDYLAFVELLTRVRESEPHTPAQLCALSLSKRALVPLDKLRAHS
jgi:hypothetical protein